MNFKLQEQIKQKGGKALEVLNNLKYVPGRKFPYRYTGNLKLEKDLWKTEKEAYEYILSL